jgi:MFS family permease
VAGFGNGVMLVYERLIIQELVPDRLAARVFGIRDALTAWAYAFSFIVAGGLVSLFGPRPVLIASGAGVLLVAAVTAVLLRGERTLETATGEPRPVAAEEATLEYR